MLIPATLHEMLDMLLLLTKIWRQERVQRQDHNSRGRSSPGTNAPLIPFLKRIEAVDPTSDASVPEGKKIHEHLYRFSLTLTLNRRWLRRLRERELHGCVPTSP